jgi:hypothetical protein
MSTPEVILTFAGWGSIFLALYLIKRKRDRSSTEERSD